MRRSLFALNVFILISASIFAETMVPTEALAVGPVGRYGRVPFHRDPVHHALIMGDLREPVEGDVLFGLDEAQHEWHAVTVNEEGWFESSSLRGGYAWVNVEADAAGTYILDASGHGMVYVNGEPRMGDLYETGYVKLPVSLKAGQNSLLFHVTRGRFRASLRRAEAAAALNPDDLTLPDRLRNEDPDEDLLGAVPVMNLTADPLIAWVLDVEGPNGAIKQTALPTITPYAMRKVPISFPYMAPGEDETEQTYRIRLKPKDQDEPVDEISVMLRVRDSTDTHRRTFVSDIDGSVQYYAVTPAKPDGDDAPPAFVLSLHGAGVEAQNQAEAYTAKPWCTIVAPTNRRPFGFDWEDWGRWDALEVWDEALRRFPHDPHRVYLTGHSMGGHGTWHLGVTFPDRFAAIGPCAGWPSFGTYALRDESEAEEPLEALFHRAIAPSRTLDLVGNLAVLGVYILHGDADRSVPVEQARRMRTELGAFHPNFAYYEKPGGGHWWGDDSMDWPPLFAFLQDNTLPAPGERESFTFTTASPAVSSHFDGIHIHTPRRMMELASITVDRDHEENRITLSTDNVARIAIEPHGLDTKRAIEIELDEQLFPELMWPEKGEPFWFQYNNDGWTATERPAPLVKGPHRFGPFKEAFQNRMVFVYGTAGTEAETAWAYAKARFDAESFWYRGNGAVDLVSDDAFTPEAYAGRNIVLYGNADTNGAWSALLPDAPIQACMDGVRIGERVLEGDALGLLFVYPRHDCDRSSVAVVGGTGLEGMALTERLPYFVSGVGYPDWAIFGSETLLDGISGVRAAGYFTKTWELDPTDSTY